MASPFASFLQAGFECSCHRMPDGRRLDLIESTGHARWAGADYARLPAHGMRTARDGARWHLIGRTPGRYDWSSLLPLVRGAETAGVQVIWDLCHYGWPDRLDIWSARFVDEFARYAGAAAALVRDETARPPLYCPVNEISYWAWAGGDMAHFGPCGVGRGGELKRQLVRATLGAMDAIAQADPRARFVLADPIIQVHAAEPAQQAPADAAHAAQFEAWDMLAGRAAPELGGSPECLDIVGVNYYPHNQWIYGGPRVVLGEARYRPLRELLAAVHQRYARPVLIAETGAEGPARAPWLRYACDEAAHAMAAGADIQGICLYPVTDYPGWGDDRHCPTGLFGPAGGDGSRPVYEPLARELARQAARFAAPRPQPACAPAEPTGSGV